MGLGFVWGVFLIVFLRGQGKLKEVIWQTYTTTSVSSHRKIHRSKKSEGMTPVCKHILYPKTHFISRTLSHYFGVWQISIHLISTVIQNKRETTTASSAQELQRIGLPRRIFICCVVLWHLTFSDFLLDLGWRRNVLNK